MSETRWIISDIAKKTGIEAHVLRYWEKELELEIPRNELGHRYYLDSHVQLFIKIHELKESGYQLKAIKNVLGSLENITGRDRGNIIVMPTQSFEHEQTPMPIMKCENRISELEETANGCKHDKQDKMEQFKAVLGDVMLETLAQRDKEMSEQISKNISERIIKQMDYLMRMQEELEDERFKRLDETIRAYQKDRHAIGNTASKGQQSKKRLFGRKNRVVTS